MKKHITKIAILFLMISLAGCRKDFLDREPISDLTEGNFFKTGADAEAAIKDQGMDPYTRLLNRLKTANESVKSTFDDISDYIDDANVKEYVQTLYENTSNLKNLVEDD